MYKRQILCGMFARTLARAGAAVALLDINLEAAEETARDIREAGGTAAAYGVDVMDKEMLESVHARVLARLGPVSYTHLDVYKRQGLVGVDPGNNN